jgi:sugar phosphate isomerase/epimerase
MRLGIFAKTFPCPTLAETLDAVVAHGLDYIQYNFACAGLPSMPDELSPEAAQQMGDEIQKRRLTVVAVSGTFNMIHPDPQKRKEGLRRLTVMAAACPFLKTSTITLCTGTRDPEDMWRHHPQNNSPDAWRDLLATLTAALEIAEKFQLTLGIEPEMANVVSSASKARKLLDEVKSPRVKIIFDAANLFQLGELSRQREILDEAFNLLGDKIISAHAKDVREENGAMKHVAAGKGSVDYDYYLSKLREAKFSSPLVLHGLAPSEVTTSIAWLQTKMATAPAGNEALLGQSTGGRR